jgi:hypothetical protein
LENNNDQHPKILHWEIIELSKKGNSKNIHAGIPELYTTLITELDKRTIFKDVDIVLIEKQPSFNPKMRIVAGCLQTYFYIRGVVDKIDNKIKSVDFFSPKNKLKCYNGPELDISSRSGKIVKGKYAQTKKMGIEIARVKMNEYGETSFINFFETNKKKDDLSDCYLQALTYISFKNPQTNNKVIPPKQPTKKMLKNKMREFLDSQIKNCSVMEIMNREYHDIHELTYPVDLPEPVEEYLNKMNMKKYITLKYI